MPKCATCNGVGYKIYYENQSPLGSGMVWNEELTEECPDCLELGICPNCSAQWGDSDIKRYEAYVGWETEEKFQCPSCNFEKWE